MGSNDKVSLGISIAIACLVIFPSVLVIGLILDIPFSAAGVITFIISIGLYIPSFILYLIGTSINKPKLITIGFGLGLPAWILTFIGIFFTFNSIRVLTLAGLSNILMITTTIENIDAGTIYLIARIFDIYSVPIWINIIIVLTIVSTIICIIFGSIIFYRRNNL